MCTSESSVDRFLPSVDLLLSADHLLTPAGEAPPRYNRGRPGQHRTQEGAIMIERALGRGGLRVSAVGLGCMGMSEFYDPKQMDDAESIRVIHRYLDAGGTFLDTADIYGVGRNEVL